MPSPASTRENGVHEKSSPDRFHIDKLQAIAQIASKHHEASMLAAQRNIATHDSRNGKDFQAILIALRPSNEGVSLTATSQVVIIDPFWNPHIEMQTIKYIKLVNKGQLKCAAYL